MTSIRQKLHGKNVLLTGATGFLAKLVLEKILRSVPDSGKLLVVIRSRGMASPTERLDRDVLDSTVFDRLKREWGAGFDARMRARVVAIDADLSEDRFGLSQAAYDDLARDCDVVVSCAAICTFREQLDRQMQVNTLGARRVLEFARDGGNLPMVHVSTCFVTGRNEGRIPERVLPIGETARTDLSGATGDFNIDDEVGVMLARCAQLRSDNPGEAGDRAVAEFGLQAARQHGWWDAYPFTKCLGEQLLVRDRGDVPVAIVRPSIIESSLREPVPGWIEAVRMLDPLFTEGGKGNLKWFAGDRAKRIDLIPCDLVANAVIAALPWPGATGVPVYQVCSSSENPVTAGEMADAGLAAFRKRPSRDRDGNMVHPKPLRLLPADKFHRRVRSRARQLEFLRRVWKLLGMEARARWANMMLRLLSRLEQMAELYAPYISNTPIFENTATRGLYQSLSEDDRAEFPFDVTEIDWREYLVEIHVPALQRLTGDSFCDEAPGADSACPDFARDDERRQISA